MSTLNQIRAKQQNAQLSTGPRSVETKAITRRNALKSGIDAAAATALPFENSSDLEALKNELYDQFDPATAVERDLVDDLIRDRWLLRRFATIEDQLMAQDWENHSQSGQPQPTEGRAHRDLDQTLARLRRRITATRKSYNETLKVLQAQVARAETTRKLASQGAPAHTDPSQAPQPEPVPAICADSSSPDGRSQQPDPEQSGQDLSHVPVSSAGEPLAMPGLRPHC